MEGQDKVQFANGIGAIEAVENETSVNLKTKVHINDDELEQGADEINAKIDGDGDGVGKGIGDVDGEEGIQHGSTTDTSHPANASNPNPLLKQRLLREGTHMLEVQDFKNLLKQKLQVQPWHSLYQQLTQFEYRQLIPFPQPAGTETKTIFEGGEGEMGDLGDNNATTTTQNGPNGSTITKTITTKQDIVFDVYAKVLTEHELLRRKEYHQRLRTKLLAAEQRHLESREKKLGLVPRGGGDSGLLKLQPAVSTSQDGSDINLHPLTKEQGGWLRHLPITIDEVDQDVTILMQDLVRSGDMKVSIWVEGRPTITTTVTTTTQWPKTKLPSNIDDDDHTDEEFDIFNPQKRQGWEQREAKRKQEIERKKQLELAQNALQNDQNSSNLDPNDNNPMGMRNEAISMEDEYQYPSTSFQITNEEGGDVANPNTSLDFKDWHHTDTPIITETIDQVHHTLEIQKQQFQQGTIYFEGVATFSTPNINICGLDKAQIDQLLIDMQDRRM
jgi:hypothetical protein